MTRTGSTFGARTMSNNGSIPGLLDEYPLVCYKSLARALGSADAAIMLQQIHFLVGSGRRAKDDYKFVEGEWWVYNTYEEWQAEHFTWLSISTIRRHLSRLESLKLIVTRKSVKESRDQTKWYRVNYPVLSVFVTTATVHFEQLELSRMSSSISSNRTVDYTYTPTQTPIIETTTSAAAETDAEAVYSAYESNIGTLSPFIVETLTDELKTHSSAEITDAIKESVLHNKRNLAYIKAILDRWATEGRNAVKPAKTGARGLKTGSTGAPKGDTPKGAETGAKVDYDALERDILESEDGGE